MDNNEEIWKDIPNYEGIYQASTHGNIRVLDRLRRTRSGNLTIIRKGHQLTLYLCKRNYYVVTLHKNREMRTFRVHRLIAFTFIPNIHNKLEINHINGNKIDNRVENLEWCTRSENQQHAFDTGLQVISEKQKELSRISAIKQLSKPTIQYSLDNVFINRFNSMKEASEITKVPLWRIQRSCGLGFKKEKGFIWRRDNTNN